MKRPLFITFIIALCIHILALILKVDIDSSSVNTEYPQINIAIDLENPPKSPANLRETKVNDTNQISSALAPVSVTENVPKESTADKPPEIPLVVEEELQVLEPERTELSTASGYEPPYLIDTPPQFIERGPIFFPNDVRNITESISVVVYLYLGVDGEILSMDSISEWEELKVEVFKMILKSRFSPAYVGEIPVPCIAKCVVDIVCKPI